MREAELFEYIKSAILPDLIQSPYQYSQWDCVSPSVNAYFELKCRRTHYEHLILEQKKYDAMILTGLNLNLNPWYVCSTPEGIYFFDLLHLDPLWEEMSLPKTTDFEQTQVVNKAVTLLHTKEAFSIPLP